ncbi:MAG: hypothetical protein EXS08_09975 [Planctomycetes bacterium]|nr:hypothetical protein [Planctomycetota bacterium]
MRCWVADRGAGELLALDAELCVERRLPLPSPRLLACSADVVWVGVAAAGADEFATRLVRLDSGAQNPRSAVFDGIADLVLEGSGDALVIEHSGTSTRLWRIDSELTRTLLGRYPAASALAERAGELLVGGSDGSLVRLTESGGLDAAGHWSGPVLALAPGPQAGEWWVLGGKDGANVGLVGSELEPLWIVESGFSTRAFAPVAGEERVWLADAHAARRYGPGGALEHEYPLDLGAAAWRAGYGDGAGVVLFAEGALIELALRGGVLQPARSQGGFRALSALAALP